MEKITVAIAGATGYVGVELLRLLLQHPGVQVKVLTSQSHAGQPIDSIYPHLLPYTQTPVTEHEIERLLAAQVIFLALPHGHAAPVAEAALAAGRRVIDLGPDFRLSDPEAYPQWYQMPAPPESLLRRSVYGLPEIYRDKIKGADLVANPGCYPTGALLALAPALRRGLVEADSLIIDAKSGVTGAGRGLSLATLYGEVNEGLHPYGVTTHRHTPEIEQELTRLGGREVRVTFTPHLVPMSRGILTTAYARLSCGVDPAEVRAAYEEDYRYEPFVHLLPSGTWPHTKWVYGSNHCLLGLEVDRRTGWLVVASAIDNLVKGAAGQAVQNFNLMFGLEETTGLAAVPMYP